MKKISSLLFAFTIFICISFQRPLNDNSCKIMRNGTFVYGNPSSEVKVVIKGDKHIEYHHEGKYIIKSRIKWLNDCEYNMTMTEITIPQFPYTVGDIMNVKITRVEGNNIFYTSTVKGNSWEGQFTKVK